MGKKEKQKIQQCSCWLLANTSISLKRNNKQVDHAKSQAGTDLELGPSHGHVDPVGVWPPPQVLVVVCVVHRVVELVVDLGKPESGKWSANLRKLRFLFFARTQQRFGEAWKNYLQIYTNFYVCLLPVRNRDLGKPMKWKLIQCLLANPIRICQKGVKHRAKYQLRLQSNIHQITKNCFSVRSL